MSVQEVSELSVKDKLFEIAQEYCGRGPGYAQESVVLREAADRLNLKTLEEQQLLLTCWHQLFSEGKLALGYDIDNPSHPFFHIPKA